MKISYLMNQHPYASCTFIRREIVELEAKGLSVSRFSIRRPESKLVDVADQQELAKTWFIFDLGWAKLLLSVVRTGFSRPRRFFNALRLALKIGRKSDRGIVVNLAYLVEACVVLDWCKSLAINHIHAHFGSNPASVAMLCRVLGGPSYSFTIHGPHEFDNPEALAIPEKIQYAAFVVAISEFTKSRLSCWSDHSHWSKIHVVHCGVDRLFLEQEPQPLPAEPRFVSVGRLGEQKGHFVLVQAVSKLASEGLKFKVILVGDGPLRGQIETLIDRLRLQDYIEITGWATNVEVQQSILNAQIMVLPSFAEGLPVVFMESLALGRPVLSTYVAGIPELVKPGECGWLVPSGSVDALADAMRQVLNTPISELERMGKIGAERVAKLHDAKVEAGRLMELFEKYSQVW
jgi:glycosyltransferase involved in cell wall biosynthesis